MADVKTYRAKTAEWAMTARSNPYFARALIVAGVVALLDQASKLLIVHVVELPERIRVCAKAPEAMCRQIAVSPIFDLTYVQNYGASFGMLSGGLASRIILSLVSIGVSVGLTIWLAKAARMLTAAGIGLIIGGALGNLVDRLAYGYVVDFLDFSGLYFPWVFNVADAAINVGVGVLLLDAFLTRDQGAETKTG